jgi:hypothetical protein
MQEVFFTSAANEGSRTPSTGLQHLWVGGGWRAQVIARASASGRFDLMQLAALGRCDRSARQSVLILLRRRQQGVNRASGLDLGLHTFSPPCLSPSFYWAGLARPKPTLHGMMEGRMQLRRLLLGWLAIFNRFCNNIPSV